MVKLDNIIEINFCEEDIETMNCQEAPKFMLRCMCELSKISNNGLFKYSELLDFMRSNYNNELFYKGHGISSIKNLDYYWRYGKSKCHSANIENFENLVKIIN